MANPRRFACALTSVVALTASAACHRKAVVETPAPVQQTATQQPATMPAPTPSSPTTSALDPARSGQRAALEDRIYFEFDRAELSPAARATLATKIEILRTTPTITLRIEGHADERGSDEYNLVLSNRRAAEVKRFLVQQDLSESRLEIAGYGEEQPLETGHDEQAWSKNRRADFHVTGGLTAQ